MAGACHEHRGAADVAASKIGGQTDLYIQSDRGRMASYGIKITDVNATIVIFQQPPRSADDAIKAADTLMYKVKNHGKNAVAFEDFDFQATGITVPQVAARRV